MRKVIYSFSVSLDGYLEGPNGELDWSFPDRELHEHFNEQERAIGTILYGRRLYELMAGFWPTADANPAAPAFVVEYARIWKSKPKVVFSKTLEQVGWNARLVRENVAEEVQRLKAQPGADMSVGGAGLAASFMQFRLIDEFWLYVHPVILGAGKPMLPALDHRINLRLVETRTFGSGVVLLRHQRADGGEA